MTSDVEKLQHEVCKRFRVPHVPSPANLKVGISLNVRENVMPVNGLRHPPEGDTTGWYIWAGTEFREEDDFFNPLHVSHISEWSPMIEKYLGLPPGWRFLVHGDYEDVWFDETLLDI
jgi:hypothetical protein